MRGGRVRLVLAAAIGVVTLTGCQLKDDGDNLVNGKTLFAQNCASCHQLARAGAQGSVGPSLDEAWARAEIDGLGRSTYEGVVHRQILQPNSMPQVDPATGEPLPLMPAKIVDGEDAEDVAAYVAYAAARPGEDTGRLATAGVQRSEEVAKEQNGTLDIPADPSGATLYQFGSAEAQPGQVTVNSVNESSTPHDIALEGNGVDEKGEVVQDGGTSTFSVDLQPGEYTFYCTVPGHREGGMEGKLTVK
jgi:plastocyanin